MTKTTKLTDAEKSAPADAPATQPDPDRSLRSERSLISDRPDSADPTNFTKVEVTDAERADARLTDRERNERTRDVAYAAIPPVVQLDASDDAEIERRQEARLKRPRQDLQAALERSQAAGFVPAESAESIAFRNLKSSVAKEVRAEVLAEKADVGRPLLDPDGTAAETTTTTTPDPDSK